MTTSISSVIQGGNSVGSTSMPPYLYAHLHRSAVIQSVIRGRNSPVRGRFGWCQAAPSRTTCSKCFSVLSANLGLRNPAKQRRGSSRRGYSQLNLLSGFDKENMSPSSFRPVFSRLSSIGWSGTSSARGGSATSAVRFGGGEEQDEDEEDDEEEDEDELLRLRFFFSFFCFLFSAFFSFLSSFFSFFLSFFSSFFSFFDGFFSLDPSFISRTALARPGNHRLHLKAMSCAWGQLPPWATTNKPFDPKP
mmetsp:Transcript_57462/g.180541  ORF Transcript_57462/g.180541 Transcript_57462/m.180541 type:complete len:248 (+) Transcript_57462:534-1277(+)